MGARTCFVAWVDPGVAGRSVFQSQPESNSADALALALRLYPRRKLERIGDGNLADHTNPAEGKLFIGCFRGVKIIATQDLRLEKPSQLDRRFRPATMGRVILHSMVSSIDWFAFALWETESSSVR